MKNTFKNRNERFAKCRSSISGVALVIVLIMLSLVAVLLVAFLGSTSTELRSAKSYAVGLDARSLNDSAVSIVISQIQDATSVATNAWASQPGMIRTYDKTGNAVTAYKLYSSDKLRVAGAFSADTSANISADVPNASTWANQPDQYVDLNKPVTVSGVSHYPIINPGAVANGQASITPMEGTNAPIQGCYLNTSNQSVTTNSTQPNPVPMPVKWLYILQDGNIATISTTGEVTDATKDNPIVGRIAFWTDDETCKVNVNTSGEGTFWDRPMTESIKNAANNFAGYERNFIGTNLPGQSEYQRFPGHPAMTSLSVIFPPGTNTPAYNEAIYRIIPRLSTGGSVSGTVMVATNNVMTPNTDRLYASVDEFLFNGTNTSAPRGPNWNPSSADATNAAPKTLFTETDVERVRFFLTANSRAPEVNMFNKPRVTLWPIQSDPLYRSAKDQLIAFCSTVGNTNSATSVPYYFQRFNTYTTPRRTGATTYPASLTQSPIPSSQSPTLDWTLNNTSPNWTAVSPYANRNQALFGYLQSLTEKPIPGLGGSLAGSGTSAKYSYVVRDQILTEMMDFIRSEIASATTGGNPSYFYAPGVSTTGYVTGERQVAPLVITPPTTSGNPTVTYKTKGFGRFPTIKQMALVFYRQDRPVAVGNSNTGFVFTQGTTPYSYPVTNTPTTPINIGAVVMLDPWNSTPGSRPWCQNVRYVVSGLNSIRINSTQLPIPDGSTLLTTAIDQRFNATAAPGPEYLFRYAPLNTKAIPKTNDIYSVGSPTEEQFYPLAVPTTLVNSAAPATNNIKAANIPTSIPIAYPNGTNTFLFRPSTTVPITIDIYSGYDSGTNSGALVQTLKMNFPSTPTGAGISLPMPTVPVGQSTNAASANKWAMSDTNYVYTDFNARIGRLPNPNGGTYSPQGPDETGHSPSPFFITGDVVRNLEAKFTGPAKGDLRIYSALPVVPQEYFTWHGTPATYSIYSSDTNAYSGFDGLNYNDSSAASSIIHSFRMYPIPGNTDVTTGHGAYTGTGGPAPRLISSPTYNNTNITGASPAAYGSYLLGGAANKYYTYPAGVRGLNSYVVQLTGMDSALHPGDWDTGPGNQPDGPYINKPDESNAGSVQYYLSGIDDAPEEQGSTYSPNRQISSAVAFGSLPTGVDQLNSKLVASGRDQTAAAGGIRPWQTLLFCANPASEAGNTGAPYHPGFGLSTGGLATNAPPYSVPPDSAFLDFFTMPIVEPYALSEPFSTAGKVNMNYQIVPFTYLTRDTAVRSVLKSTRMMAIPTVDAGTGQPQNTTGTTACYKVPWTSPLGPPSYRYTINPDEINGTLAGFQKRFAGGDIFRSAAEICGLYLVPEFNVDCTTYGQGETVSTTPTGATYDTMNTWWANYRLTGDNVREQPYGHIYPRLTTKSNSYTVHVWTQTIQKAKTANPKLIVSGQDQITSEYRGSYILQRYLDPNSDTLISTDGTTATEQNQNSMVGPYKFRVVATKRFAP